MTRIGVLAATALSLSLAIGTPVLAQQTHGGRTGAHAASGAARMGGPAMGARSNFAGAQANFQSNAAGRTNFAGRGGQAQFAQRGGESRGYGGRGFGRGAGFALGAATGAAIAAGDYGYGEPYYYGGDYAYDTGYYGDSYAYDAGPGFYAGVAAPIEGPVAVAGDAAYCAQRYRSYDPASGTYLGFDGLRHPCM